MGKNINESIEKLDKQIEKLSSNKYDDNLPKMSKKELSRKVKLAKLDEEIERNKKKNKSIKSSDSVTTKTINLEDVKKEINDSKNKTITKLSVSNTKPIKKTSKIVSKASKLKEDLKVETINKKELINEVLDNQTEVDKLIKLLTKVFTILISLLVILFMIVCFI
ncbi:MAG: hypothetical protein E7160_04830 [Firmicutes bacterium]|nr:hypothetical protein [Bacillota bacterium]